METIKMREFKSKCINNKQIFKMMEWQNKVRRIRNNK